MMAWEHDSGSLLYNVMNPEIGFNPLPHGVLATFSLTAWGFMGPP
jgi:hypothetical protein